MAELVPDDIDFEEYLELTDHQEKVKPACDFVALAKADLRGRAKQKRTYLPWPKCNDYFEFRPGEVTLWGGQNGHGKTDVSMCVAMSLLGQEEKVCIASFEMPTRKTIARLVRLYAQTNPFSEEYLNEEGFAILDGIYDEFADWTRGRMWLYDQLGTAKTDTVLGMVKYCAVELGITHIFIDSLMKCIANEDDYNCQKYFVDQLCAIAKDTNVHIHLVHHLKKPPKESDLPDKHDIKGSGSITDQVDNLFLVWRNKAKEDERKSNSAKQTKSTEADMILLCKKQRHYDGSKEGEPRILLWRHADSGCFVANQGDEPLFFVNYPHRPT